MKTLRELKEIDRYLLGKLDTSSSLLFEARLLIDPALKLRVAWQRRLYSIIRNSGRRQIRAEAARIHHQLFNDPARRDWQLRIHSLFSKK